MILVFDPMRLLPTTESRPLLHAFVRGTSTKSAQQMNVPALEVQTSLPPSVSLVIVTYRSARLLPDLFQSLPAALAGIVDMRSWLLIMRRVMTLRQQCNNFPQR